MRRTIAMVLLVCGALAVGCGGGDKQSVVDGDGARDKAVAAMEDVSSYRVEMDFGEGDPLVWDYVKPNSYRTYGAATEAEPGERALRETVYIGSTIYFRACEGLDTNCGEWTSKPRAGVIIGAISPTYFPHWPLVALEMANRIEASTQGGDIRIAGAFNTVRSVLESERRILAQEGRRDFGRECTSVEAPAQVEQGSPYPTAAPVTPQETCRDTTYEDALQEEADVIAFYDEHPATIEATVDSKTFHVARIELSVPSQEPGADSSTFVITYSKVNSVTIEAPE